MRRWYTAVPPDLRDAWPFDFETYRLVCVVWSEMRWALGGTGVNQTWQARMQVRVRYAAVCVPG